ncbi:copper resistance CopC family protein [Burkholderia alba]|uniref:copper resistance CopC family protein n=1 Tax=Burkholderia alba TaxID=2683677 RepID=UPI002B052915|nr:copper resistance CopC family protein [Burkholderia alba]
MSTPIRLLLLVPILAAALAAPVYAHGRLERALPEPGASVAASPAALRLTFNEDLEAAFSTLRLTRADGAPVDTGSAKAALADPRTLALPMPALEPGAYVVHWSVMTGDGHKARGRYPFQVRP